MEKVYYMLQRLDNINKQMEILSKVKKEMLEFKNTNKNTFDGFISRLNTVKKNQ